MMFYSPLLTRLPSGLTSWLLNLKFLCFTGYLIFFLHSSASFWPSSSLLSLPCTMAFTWYSLIMMVTMIIMPYLTRLHHTGKLCPKLAVTVGYVLFLDPPAAVVHQDSPEAKLIGVESCRGHTNICSYSAHIHIINTFLSHQISQGGFPKLGIVKECRVGVNIGVYAFMDYFSFRMHLNRGARCINMWAWFSHAD